MGRRLLATGIVVLAAVLGVVGQLSAYPGGTPRFVTNAEPFCAGCHSSVSVEQLKDLPAEAAIGMTPEKKHYSVITAGERNYTRLSPEDREKLLSSVKAMDANSHVEVVLSAARVKPLGKLTATVRTRGGAGPVVGVMLVDTDQRFQSSPIQTAGFLITAPPQAIGQDGKPQTKFLDGRIAGLSKNINYVNISDVKSDPETNTYAECSVVYSLRAPAEPGEYTVTAAFLYGTEKASALGRVEAPGGRLMPVGGQSAESGRIQFARIVKLTVVK